MSQWEVFTSLTCHPVHMGPFIKGVGTDLAVGTERGWSKADIVLKLSMGGTGRKDLLIRRKGGRNFVDVSYGWSLFDTSIL